MNGLSGRALSSTVAEPVTEAKAQHGNDDQDCIGIFGFGLVLHGAHYPRMINVILLLICDK